MSEEKIIKIRFEQMNSSYLNFLDSGGILHITNFYGGLDFLEAHRNKCFESAGLTNAEWKEIFINRNLNTLKDLGKATKLLKKLVHNHAFTMSVLPVLEKIGCSLDKTHVDCGVIRYQLIKGLREKAESSGYFEKEDFLRINPNSIPEIFGYSKLPPHRDVRWPHVRIIGGWMPLTDVDEEETLTLFPEVFSQNIANTDPNITPYPNINHPNEFNLGKPFSPSMKAGEFLFFNAATVHCSPVAQSKDFRGSIDFRIAFPCLDDFEHYKWTFIQSKNLINLNNKKPNINYLKQKKAFLSYVEHLFKGKGEKLSIYEIYKDQLFSKQFSLKSIFLILNNHFCPDTLFNVFDKTNLLCQRIILINILCKSKSYFWLFKGYKLSRKSKFLILSILFRLKTIYFAKRTTLKIVNKPLNWPGGPRELLPEEVLKKLS